MTITGTVAYCEGLWSWQLYSGSALDSRRLGSGLPLSWVDPGNSQDALQRHLLADQSRAPGVLYLPTVATVLASLGA